MGRVKIILILTLLLLMVTGCTVEDTKPNTTYGIVIHGGASSRTKAEMSDEQEKEYVEKLNEALSAGHEILKNGGRSLDAVEAAIVVMEDSPLFNAGKGAVFANNEKNEMDASIMDGATLNTGAIAGVHNVKNPIKLARLVMEETDHVLLARDGAEELGHLHNIEFMPDEYFYTENRWNYLQKVKASDAEKGKQSSHQSYEQNYFGTVGAAALDKNGNLAAGTSTGGMTNKKWGRIGDSPIIGAGTYANNNTCAVSCTGHGEYFIRNVVAYDVSALMEYKGMTIKDAAESIINNKLVKQKGSGGLIGIDKNGNVSMPFNTKAMARGFILEDNKPVILFDSIESTKTK